ncbi:nitrate- and nitrite sensing domain-containing protein [Streptomyces sp. HSW2009]|uniref:nitrate- and nitrite sensing domain-containing protein n=1 Tax=Streptomyces sp. HSW2009 TaxID=3142890 RepID=UPI0032EB6E15
MLIPVLVALVFGGLRVSSSVETWQQAQDAERTARLVRAAAEYGHALVNERDVAVVPLLSGRESDQVQRARRATDEAAKQFDRYAHDMPDDAGLERRLKEFRTVEPRLNSLRQNAYTQRLPGVQTEEGYVTVQHPLMDFANELGLGTSNITSYGRTVYVMSLAKAAESLQRSIGAHLLTKPGPTDADRAAQLTAFSSYAYLTRLALMEFESGGLDEDSAHLKTALKESAEKYRQQVAKDRAAHGDGFVTPPSKETMAKAIGSGAKPSDLRAQGITADAWYAASTAEFDAYRTVEVSLLDKAVDEAAGISSDARRDTFVNSAVVLVALLAAFVVAGLMARAMSQNMRRLRNAALEVAEQRLPEMVEELSRTEPGHADPQVPPIPIASRDEIGEIARAFDQVHREAVRLAAEQALLRGNVNAIFTNLSRRNQGLIERQLTLISALENREADPDQLEHLFRMDHLATRMRRNGENLLVLAGEEPGRRWNQPVPLVDVLRAASSEVESYERIELAGVPDSEIHGNAVTDLVHLLAELLENATTFSSPQSRVRITGTRLPDGRVVVEIHDQGIGLTAEDFADINHKLAYPPTVDAAVSQRMGLFVVGRLANRHGIRVQLRPAGEQSGTTSLVMLPEPITHGGGGDEEQPAGDFTVSPIVPDQPTGEHPQPAAAAPGSGHGDPGYGAGPGAPYATAHDGGYGAATTAPYQANQADQLPSPVPYEPATDGGYGAGVDTGQGAYAAPGAGQDTGAGGYPVGYANGPTTGYPAEFAPGDQAAADGAGYGAGQQVPGPIAPSELTGQVPLPAAPEGAAGAAGAGLTGPAGYPSDSLRDGAYPEGGYADQSTTGQFAYDGHGAPGHQGGWSGSGEYPVPGDGGYPGQTEPPLSAAEDGFERVEFHRPGQAPDGVQPVTDAGLPRRDQQWQGPDATTEPSATADARTETADPAPEEQAEPEQQTQPADSGWRSTNDERWQRAEQLREPKAGGVTLSGLPRRVPQANLVEGTAEEGPQGGPQVSRSPEDIRGRLSSLRRGVQQGRTVGTGTGQGNTAGGSAGAADGVAGDGTHHDSHHQHDQQGFGPGSTYDQER